MEMNGRRGTGKSFNSCGSCGWNNFRLPLLKSNGDIYNSLENKGEDGSRTTKEGDGEERSQRRAEAAVMAGLPHTTEVSLSNRFHFNRMCLLQRKRRGAVTAKLTTLVSR